ncbi:pyruvate dehydrogenase [Acrocarpospora phusangensis]|uniref:Pyruvate dehydrogenase E1 component subunit beta n=1 Tax=Acrocarpospora phusangensis TaxID=1070424 RepID=A0A919QFQ6_9ACTN|nr:transketolase C-terminal domain-containing protein [Acrocarpospora phusangensis]GIH28016.1 pyruvate dehydrogenase [Acrocarpospora phusangensis]
MRVAEHLNEALHALLDADPSVHVLGEDIADPYGGAFKITKGLSSKHGSRVISTPLSEGGIVGVGAGLALAGDRAIVEIMFGDFAALAFDQLLNFASKSTTMYGRRVPIPLVVRCPTGGRRGYGPTHSQSLQKHFIGIPGLDLYELSPFHDAHALLATMFARQNPCVLFEDKVLYTRRVCREGVVDDLFRFELTGGWARVYADGDVPPDCVIIAPGGLTDRCLEAMRDLLMEDEITCELLVPERLYPLDPAPVMPILRGVRTVCVAEDGSAGGTWGAEVARLLHPELWASLSGPIRLVSAADSIIPTAAHLEREVLVQADTIRKAVLA